MNNLKQQYGSRLSSLNQRYWCDSLLVKAECLYIYLWHCACVSINLSQWNPAGHNEGFVWSYSRQVKAQPQTSEKECDVKVEQCANHWLICTDLCPNSTWSATRSSGCASDDALSLFAQESARKAKLSDVWIL